MATYSSVLAWRIPGTGEPTKHLALPKVQGADTGWGQSQGWGQVKAELALGQGSRDTRQEEDGGDARGGKDGVEVGWRLLLQPS